MNRFDRAERGAGAQRAARAICAACGLAVSIATPALGRTTLQVWSLIGTPAEWQAIGAVYEKSHPGVDMRVSIVDEAKFLVAAAGGSAPDVMGIGGSSVPNYAMRKLILPLDSYLVSSKLSEDDFFHASWRKLQYKGHTWALPSETNPCFALLWNKTLLAEAGLDPAHAPETLEDLDEMSAKLARPDPKGNSYQRLGFIPPSGTYNYVNTIMNWGWIFGGSFYDEATGQFTVNHPRNVRALEWVVALTKRYDPRLLAASGGALGLEPFLTGKAALCTAVPNYTIALMKQRKLSFKYGITSQQPYPTDGVKGVSWESGYTFAIPTGSKRPKPAWEFVRWLCASDEGSMAYYNLGSARLTGYRRSPIFKRLAGNSDLDDATVEVLEGARYHRPVSPATNLLMKELEPAGLAAVSVKKTPQQALDEVQVKVTKELARYAKY